MRQVENNIGCTDVGDSVLLRDGGQAWTDRGSRSGGDGCRTGHGGRSRRSAILHLSRWLDEKNNGKKVEKANNN